ncbi:ABC transporter substrate-binding protein [Sagittula sp. MA-2]|jgi:ABC-type Fe3+ transport system substrate-binding protein|uniref:ABC transporter substrate-binding protein n=1 Tax=Sagittula sp. MA-2 TaxID=3048007 RepID=UPI0024C301BE|nr:ABC transporter substrate-binding protein [Sagittula sp. MA-2]WHZ36659.1 ABC transporter substrate-binding protein [Sagittula sp. MA-2]
MTRLLCLILMCALFPRAAAAQEDRTTFGTGASRLDVRSTTDIDIIRPVMERFVEANPDLSVNYEQWGSNNLFRNSRDACAGRIPAADAVLSSGVHQLVWLVNAACGHTYRSESTAALPASRRWRDELWGITEEPAVIIYNLGAFKGDDVPRSRFALLDMMRNRPDLLQRRIATYDIAASGLGYLFAHADSLEATTFGAMLEGFARVQAVATCCSSEIIDAVAEGRFLIAYNVLGSYVASDSTPNVGVIQPEDYTLILSRGFMIPRTAPNKAAAVRLLDFLLSPQARDALRAAGLVMEHDPSETALLQSARRPIPLSPPLLVALDQQRRETLLSLWQGAFNLGVLP